MATTLVGARNGKVTLYVLCALLALLSVGAIVGGGSMIRDRSGAALGMDVAFLARTPFPDYLVPGWILLGVLGVYPLVVVAMLLMPRRPPAAGVVRRLRVHGGWSAGVALMVWITVQMATTPFFFLQPVMLGLGLALVIVGTRPSVRR